MVLCQEGTGNVNQPLSQEIDRFVIKDGIVNIHSWLELTCIY